jgi:deazaflavin-dependent oxidoreductase (nitroreductase family)
MGRTEIGSRRPHAPKAHAELELPMTTARSTAPQVPSIVNRLNPLMRRLLRLGLPMGPNVLISIRGRKSGELRTFPVAILEADGRTLLFSSFGEVNWVRNLRAAGELTLRRGRRDRSMTARELSPEEAAPLLEAAVLPAISMPVFGSMLKSWYGVDRDSTPADYLAAARLHPGFELRDAA